MELYCILIVILQVRDGAILCNDSYFTYGDVFYDDAVLYRSEMGLYCIMIVFLQVRDGAAGLRPSGTVPAGETGPECLHRGRGPQL